MSALSVFTQVILPTGVVIGVVVVGVHGINKRRRRDIDRVIEDIDALGEVVAVAIAPVQVQQKRRRASSAGDVVVPFPGPPAEPRDLRILVSPPSTPTPPPRSRASRVAGLAWKVAPRLLTGAFIAIAVVLLAVVYGAPPSRGHGEDLSVLPPAWGAPIEPNPVAGNARSTVTHAPSTPAPAPTTETQAPAPATQAPAPATQAPAPAKQAPAPLPTTPSRAPASPTPTPAPPIQAPTTTITPPAPPTTPSTTPVPVQADGKPGHGRLHSDYMVKPEACVVELHVLVLNVGLACHE